MRTRGRLPACFPHPLTRAEARVPAMPRNSPYRPANRWAGWSPRPGTARPLCGGARQRGARDGGNSEEGGDGACYRMPAGLMTRDDPGVFSTGPGAEIVIGTFAWHAACFINLTGFLDALGP
jgi:hypothetical protein